MSGKITISIVSHNQLLLASQLIDDLARCATREVCEVLLTLNIKENAPIVRFDCDYPVQVIQNATPLGFGANHNAAFKLANGDFFCVLNPDIRLTMNPFPTLLEFARQNDVGVVAPRVVNNSGQREDSERSFPTPWELMNKIAGGKSVIWYDAHPVSSPDWIAGMFMLFPRKVFEKIGGFDERYFLYYEDVDICARLALAGYSRLVCQDVAAVHDARRSSHTNPRYAATHLRSMIRYFLSGVHRDVQKNSR